jgi:integrase/recombinase XerD
VICFDRVVSVLLHDMTCGGLTPVGVTQVVVGTAHRAGLGVIYAHRLRLSAATSMLAEGGSLAEIG